MLSGGITMENSPKPNAAAVIKGSANFPNITGVVRFYQTRKGVLVRAEISGLPTSQQPCAKNIFGFHIHEGDSCTGNAADPFADAKTHFNPTNCPHPAHAGDMPPLFGNDGLALMTFLTDRFSVEEVIGKTVVIHDMPDDFTSQPAGNSGPEIACGKIETV